MKKTMLLLCSIMVSTGMIMAGCEKQTPTDVVNTYFSTLKKSSDSETKKLIESTIPKDAINTNTSESSDNSKTSDTTSAKSKDSDSKSTKSSDDKMDQSLKTYLSKVDAKVLSEKVSNDKATVKVKVNAPNYSNLLLEVMEDSITNTLTGKEVSQAQVEKSLEEKIKSSKSETRTGEVNLVKKDNKWTIKSDDNITNLLLGEADETESIMYSK
ncbi:MAG: hypothetical protein PUJ51_14300 [Clostridiales bacterium]|uniref:hypothetical protein n=1 Tax=Terrisporobacter sp. TaxID=1965305 RepID=UPI002A409B2B|nr:hypothetical protein [Terrisporobacter sp.]MCI6459612.1 hypothetical protein [Clostridium sp.]MDD5878807.1 hypothetical protein [Clostridiales bacterium]MCI7204770.1 hypothetical protein [Clostridium sp.]MDD7755656.1 hypothetical protein [Clostridiales bacterium]MDY4135200.1 hypothetical protein [Terrisporobacter sp.]